MTSAEVLAPHRSLRDTLARYPTGVAVVTTAGPVGLTVNSFTSVSLDPPLVLWCLRGDSTSRAAFEASPRFAVNVLEADQGGLARQFAGPAADRFAGVGWVPGPDRLPILGGTVAWLRCRRYACLPGGDHVVFLGEVEAHAALPGAPLAFCDGEFLPAGSARS
ncbi:flavin reductase family protein [Longispora urticae]